MFTVVVERSGYGGWTIRVCLGETRVPGEGYFLSVWDLFGSVGKKDVWKVISHYHFVIKTRHYRQKKKKKIDQKNINLHPFATKKIGLNLILVLKK